MSCAKSGEGVCRRVKWVLSVAAVPLAYAGPSWAQDWPMVAVIGHNAYQAVDAEGGSTYSQTFPIRLRGVVLNDNQDWLDPTEAYNETTWNLGGEAELFVQAVDLDGTPYDEDAAAAHDDFGGTAVWIGQCYGNLPWIGDPQYNNYADGTGWGPNSDLVLADDAGHTLDVHLGLDESFARPW